MDLITLATSAFGVSTLGAAAVSLTVFCPQSQVWAPVVRHIADSKAVALTFDDGPTEPFTSQILDLLRDRQTRATFFVIGQNAARHPGLIRRIHDEGHTLGNHTMDHHHHGIMHFTGYWHGQIASTSDLIFAATGTRPLWFRPPMGFKTPFQAQVLRQLGLRVAGWNRRAFDTRPHSPRAIEQAIIPRLTPRDIIMLHDGVEPGRPGTREPTVDALPAILDALTAQGLRSVALPSPIEIRD